MVTAQFALSNVVDSIAIVANGLLVLILRGAGMDVHAKEGDGNISPLADLPNVVLTPHMGASTVDSQREIGERVLEILKSFVAESTERAS